MYRKKKSVFLFLIVSIHYFIYNTYLVNINKHSLEVISIRHIRRIWIRNTNLYNKKIFFAT